MNYELHVYLIYFLLYWMLEMQLNLNILQLFFLVYYITVDRHMQFGEYVELFGIV